MQLPSAIIQAAAPSANGATPTALGGFAGDQDVSTGYLLALLDELDTGVLLCSADGQVLLANDMARRELAAGEALGVCPGGHLVASQKASGLALSAALYAAVHCRRRQLVPVHCQGRRMVAMVVPLACREGALPRALVLLGRRQLTTELAVQMLGSLYRLTAAEGAVLGSLLAGNAVGEVARMRGVKLSTARTQTAALRAKMGVKRNHDLALLAAELPPITSALRSQHLPYPTCDSGG
jgi:DNA-binding CsgD family transcriptional regulator